MEFCVQKSQKYQNFSLVYRNEDYSFDIEPYDGSGFTSIMINDLQLEINDEGKVIYVWGLCPLLEYKETEVAPQKYSTYSLVAQLDKPPTPGVSYRLNEDSRWPIHINKKRGWICIGNPKIKNNRLIEFAPDCIATMDGQELIAIWLRPKNLPQLRRVMKS